MSFRVFCHGSRAAVNPSWTASGAVHCELSETANLDGEPIAGAGAFVLPERAGPRARWSRCDGLVIVVAAVEVAFHWWQQRRLVMRDPAGAGLAIYELGVA